MTWLRPGHEDPGEAVDGPADAPDGPGVAAAFGDAVAAGDSWLLDGGEDGAPGTPFVSSTCTLSINSLWEEREFVNTCMCMGEI